MKVFLLHQSDNQGWDTYDSMMVAADTEAEAKLYHPSTILEWKWDESREEWGEWVDGSWRGGSRNDWAFSPRTVTAEYIGEARPGMEAGILISSFNAG